MVVGDMPNVTVSWQGPIIAATVWNLSWGSSVASSCMEYG